MTRPLRTRTRTRWGLAVLLAFLPAAGPVHSFDIFGVQNAALDQPRVFGILRNLSSPDPLVGTDLFGDPTITVEAFLDTGASGVILSTDTVESFGVQPYVAPPPPSPPPLVLFEDVGVGGTARFNVSEKLRISIASTPAADLTIPAAYDQPFGPLRTQIGPLPSVGPIDVFGMPTMAGKVIVMDPKPLNAFVMDEPTGGLMQTYVYNPGTPYNPSMADSNPGIPATNRTVVLTYASTDRFTRLTPANAEPPAQHVNPFIGPNPLAKLDASVPAGTNPGVMLTLGDKQTTGSFLLDTGAAASVISKEMAANLSVRYRPGAPGPVLELFDPAHPGAAGTVLPEQFVLTLSGIGGDNTAAGFYLDALVLRTKEGNAANPGDPAHLRYVRVPVLVADLSFLDSLTGKTFTLDGLVAMNLLVATMFVSEDPLACCEVFGLSPYNWVVFDETNGLLLLDVAAVPEPGTWAMFLAGLALLVVAERRRLARA